MLFNENRIRLIATQYCNNSGNEAGLIESFVQVCSFLNDNPERLSDQSKKASLQTEQGIHQLAKRYYRGYRKSDFPINAGTIPDAIVSLVMVEAFGYSEIDATRIKAEHQKAMVAENCVGALLERYLDSVLRPYGWHWCCGSFVRAVDFISKDQLGSWLAIQIKNRDNSENSSSSAIRNGTPIQKWFRSFSKTGRTNWDNLPSLMQGFNLNEQGFIEFVRIYLRNNKPDNL